MTFFRNTLFWLHLACGVTAGIVIFAMCVTGALLSFERNITEAAESGMRNVSASAGKERLPESELFRRIESNRPGIKPTGITIENDPGRAVTFALGREGQIFADPYTGEITGDGAKSVRAFFNVTEDVHRYMALSGDGRPWGKAVTGVCNFMFLFLALSGIYIWMPRRLSLKHIRPNIWFRRGLGGKARDFNWHNTIGFWCSIFLVAVTLTAVVMSYQWANNLLYQITGNQPPQQQGPPGQGQTPPQPLGAAPANIDQLFAVARQRSEGWKTISVRLPVGKEATFTIDEGTAWNIFGRSSLTLDAATGNVNKWEPYSGQNAGRQIRTWFRFIHTGEAGGSVGQLIGFIACVGGAFLVYTGLSLAFRRFGRWLARRSRSTAEI